MSTKIITLITGANTGIGYELAKILLQSPEYHILLGARKPASAQEAISKLTALPTTKGTVEPLKIDITDDASVDEAAKLVESTHGRVDTVVNNAGICPSSNFAGLEKNEAPTRQVSRDVFNTNVSGQISVTETFLPLLKKSESPRLIFVGSSTGSLTNSSTPGHPQNRAGRVEYRASKAALNFVMQMYHTALKEEGIKVHGADPGLNATNLTSDPQALRNRGAPEPSVGGERVAKVVRGERDEHAGRLCGEYGEEVVCPW